MASLLSNPIAENLPDKDGNDVEAEASGNVDATYVSAGGDEKSGSDASSVLGKQFEILAGKEMDKETGRNGIEALAGSGIVVQAAAAAAAAVCMSRGDRLIGRGRDAASSGKLR